MKLRAAAFFVMALAHLALARAADVDWGRWSAERRQEAFRDMPAEVERLKASAPLTSHP